MSSPSNPAGGSPTEPAPAVKSTEISARLFVEAQDYIAGGVNSPSRTYSAVGGDYPMVMAGGNGPHFWDLDGNRYIDYLGAYGSLILGHGHTGIARAVARAAGRGTVFGTPHALEVAFAKELHAAIPSMERVRFVNSGTEAVMSAVRLARGYTGRDKLLKFSGSYHGHFDAVLVGAGSGASTLGLADSAGITAATIADVIDVPYNDPDTLHTVIQQHGHEIAAILVEPIVGNFGIVPPEPGFLPAIHELAQQAGCLVIYDEVITAFRFHYGAVQDIFGLQPDLTVVGKIIGGGLPIGAYGGSRQIMEHVAPLGPVYQDGTMAGNPVCMAAGLACLEALAEPGLYERLDEYGQVLSEGITAAAKRQGVAVQLNRWGGALAVYFTSGPVRDYAAAEAADGQAFARFFRAMIAQGINLAPSKYEAWFVSAAHSRKDIDETLDAVDGALKGL